MTSQVIVRAFLKSDMLSLNLWAAQWGMNPFTFEGLPPTGRISLIKGLPVAAAFLLKTDGVACFIEGAITNRYHDRMERRASFSPIFESLCQEARESGYKVVIASTRHPSLIQAVQLAGFSIQASGATYLARGV